MEPSHLLKEIQQDATLWTNACEELQKGKFDDKILSENLKNTQNHVKELSQTPLQAIGEGLQAIEHAQTLQERISYVKSKLTDLGRTGTQVPESVKEQLKQTADKVDNFLLQLGRNQQELTNRRALEESSSWANKLKSLLGGRAAAAAAGLTGKFRIAPESTERPYKTFTSPSTERGLLFARELAVGLDHDTSSRTVQSGEKVAQLPKIFARDVIGGFRLFLNGKEVTEGPTPEAKALRAFEAYEQALNDPAAAYLLVTLLDQTHFVPLSEKGFEVFGENPQGVGALCNVTIKGDAITIQLKNVMQSREVPPRAVMFKREITIPLESFKDSAAILSKNRAELEEWEKDEAKAKDAKDYRTQLAGKQLLFFDATAEDSYSTSLATKELALALLPEF